MPLALPNTMRFCVAVTRYPDDFGFHVPCFYSHDAGGYAELSA